MPQDRRPLRRKGERFLLDIEVKPGSRTQGITGFDTWRNRYVVHVKSPAQKGAANKEVLELLARELDAGDAMIESGQTSHSKTVSFLAGTRSLEELEAMLEKRIRAGDG